MQLPVNTLLQGGKYKIIRFINSGGFGCTYEAEHTLFNTHVAIKEFFKEDLCNRDERTNRVSVGVLSKAETVARLKKKFMEEAAAIFKMSHPGIVRVIDIFEENGTAYYVMDFIDGCSLGDMVRRCGKLPEKDALHYILQVVDALQYVHSRNRLHLDIKPGNIMVDKHGRAILIDFGASKHYNENSGKQDSTLLGINTPGYTPVEQAARNFSKFNPATDIYALGATLYTLLTGIPPTASILRADEDDENEIFNYLPSSVSASTRKALKAAMQIRSINRPQNLGEFKKMLGADTVYKEKTVYDDFEDTVEATVVDVGKTYESKKRKSNFGKQKKVINSNIKRDNTIKSNTPLINSGFFFRCYFDLILPLLLYLILGYVYPIKDGSFRMMSVFITSSLLVVIRGHYTICDKNINSWIRTFMACMLSFWMLFFLCSIFYLIIVTFIGTNQLFIMPIVFTMCILIKVFNTPKGKELITDINGTFTAMLSCFVISYLCAALIIYDVFNNDGWIFLECNLSAFIIYLLLGLYSWKRYDRPII